MSTDDLEPLRGGRRDCSDSNIPARYRAFRKQAGGIVENYREHLRKAEHRIAEAMLRLAQQEARAASRQLSAEERERAAALLASMRRTIEQFQRHRDTLLRMSELRGPRD